MVILGLVMLIERKILLWQNFHNKSKVTSDIAKYQSERGFIQQEMGIFGHAIPSHKRNIHMGIMLPG